MLLKDILTERRSHPELNKKESIHQQLLLEYQRRPDAFVRFTNTLKIGIYPATNMGKQRTPIGIYGYPLEQLIKWSGFKDDVPLSLFSEDFGNKKYVYVYSINGGNLLVIGNPFYSLKTNINTNQISRAVYEALKDMFQPPDDRDAYSSSTLSKGWSFPDESSAISLYKNDLAFQRKFNEMNNRTKSLAPSARTWILIHTLVNYVHGQLRGRQSYGQLLFDVCRSFNIDGIIDNGTDMFRPGPQTFHEPFQAVFFKTSMFNDVSVYVNK